MPLRAERIFITGGAGFIGTRLARELMAGGAQVLAYDNLLPQVHGDHPVLDDAIPLVRGDIRDKGLLGSSLHRFQPTTVVHLAAETGTGQSADEPSRYAEVNVVGTAQLIEVMRSAAVPPRRVVLAATRAVYGEGAYADKGGRLRVPPPRSVAEMAAGRFGLADEQGRALDPVPTPESIPPAPASVYGSTKLMQEYLLLQAQGPWEVAILRLQNVYGPGQSLRNPYTGVLSIFCQQAIEGQVLKIYEDGHIYRDFVFVDDVVKAFAMACQAPAAAGRVMNIGTGHPTSIAEAAAAILAELGLPANRMQITGAFRAGDVRYAVADTTLALKLLGWAPQMDFKQGLVALVAWAREHTARGS